tara:strand:+ start:25 stop:648 length:624 start_codon:yes stop_codon:yes gene_type:complete
LIVIGLTGSVAMGKSTAADMIKSFGIPVFDADKAVADLYKKQKMIRAIGNIFPEAYSNDSINRPIVAKIAFKETTKLIKLQEIIHPEVGKLRKNWIRRMAANKERVVVFDVPLLFETKADFSCDIVIVISAPYKIQKQRALSRKGWDKDRFLSIMRKQIPDSYKKKLADFVIPSSRGKRNMRIMIKEAINYSLNLSNRPISVVFKDL